METTLVQLRTAQLDGPVHPSFVNALPRIFAERRPETGCGACETIEHAISIGLDVAAYVDLQWRHRRAFHGGAR